MTDANSTIRALAEINDAGLFERLATAVLRSFNPDVYGNLSHPGVNIYGKTVKAPLDNIGWVGKAGDERIVAVAHSTCAAKDIRGKWLHDPSIVKPRKPSLKPTAPEGDLAKAIREIAEFRADRPALQATFALTSNREPDHVSLVAAQKLAADAGIDLDIWSASRLAHYLDNTTEGQWLRRTHLNAPVQLISVALLQHCARRQLDEYFSQIDSAELVERNALTQQSTSHTLLIGPSGIGKSTIAMQMLKSHLDVGGVGLVITHETLTLATSLAEAVDIELRKLETDLQAHSGHLALALASNFHPFWILVEDANRASDPPMLFNKVVKWAALKTASSSTATYGRLICPMWPRYLDSIEQKLELTKTTLLHTLGVYSDVEATDVVRRRAIAADANLLPESVASIAKALGNDPLLIGLHNFSGPPNPAKVVDAYVKKELAKAAANAPDLVHSELRQAVDQLVRQMLLHRNMAPNWMELSEWLREEPAQVKALRLVFKAGSVLRLQQRDGAEVLTPRHDRVLLSLLSRVIAEDLRGQRFNATYLADPFFAEAVGAAALIAELDPDGLRHLMWKNPLVLFHAFHLAARSNTDYQNIFEVLCAWLQQEATQGKKFQAIRFHALQLLAEIDADEVLTLTDLFGSSDRHEYWCQARFRNGDLLAGLNLLTMYPFGVKIIGRQDFFSHTFAHFGPKMIQSLLEVLARPNLNENISKGALYLAGYLGDPSLTSAIHIRWHLDAPDNRDLKAYLWASARCYHGDFSNILALVCDEWAKLPDDDEAEGKRHSRGQLTAHEITWEFREYMPVAAIPYFIQRAQTDTRLTRLITYMLREIDHPAAIEHVVRYLAGCESISSHFLLDGWERRQRELGMRMSDVTKKRLLELSFDGNNELPLRRAAFRTWETTLSPTDLEDMQAICVGHDLYEAAIWARARRGDRTVIPELIIIIPTNPEYWWQTGRYLWSSEMTKTLHKSIQDLVASKTLVDATSDGSEWILAERLMELDGQSAEHILAEEWEGVKTSPYFVQAALYHCTSHLTELAKSAIAQAEEPKKLLEYITMHMGWKNSRRKGITRIEQVVLIASYANLLSENTLLSLWILCNEQGWIAVRKKYLDASLKKSEKCRTHLSNKIDLSELDRSLEGVWVAGLPFWIDEHVRRGKSLTELMDALFNWLQSHKSIRALEIVSNIYQVSAGRKDLERLQRFTEFWPEATEVMDNLAFSIRRRTLQ